MSDLYRDGAYIQLNPSLHEEDSEYKAGYIVGLLKDLRFDAEPIRVLDIGGGAGVVAARVCAALAADHGRRVECHALDLSPEMLETQRKNNPHCTLATSDAGKIRGGRYDLALLIDVIEHIPDNGAVADMVDRIARYAVYNIPTELNLADRLRDVYMRGRYYPGLEAAFGHIHFFSAGSAKAFVAAHHRLRAWVFPDIADHILRSPAPGYARMRERRLRRLELTASRWIHRFLRPLAPRLIQGSLFMLAECRGDGAGPSRARTG